MYSMAIRNESPPIPSLPNYTFGERLGIGSYGIVYKARMISSIQSRPSSAVSNRPPSARPSSALPTFYAIKCINRKSLTKTSEDLLINEIKLLKNKKHQHIVEMYDFQWDVNYIYIVMEYCAGGDMAMFLRSRRQLSEDHVRIFVKQIAKVLKYLFENNISHMDLKPSNILLTSIEKPILKVADFGVAQSIGQQGSRSIRGTLVYMAPEILSEVPYDNRVDLWSIGAILYECLFGRPVFLFLTTDELIDKIKSETPIEIPNDSRISSDCRNLLEGLLQRDPNKRISFTDFFRHPFIAIDLTLQIKHADELLLKAIQHEKSGDLKEALNYRVKALDEYARIIRIDEDDDQRRMLRMSVQQGVIAAEVLKKRIRETAPSSELTPPATLSSLPSPVTAHHDELDLNNDKELFDAYQHCLNGNQLMNVFRFAQACEEYETGLTVMFTAAQTETKPEKIAILRKVITHYLSKLELCKARSEAQRVDLALEKIKQDAEAGTIINENTTTNETTPEEDKQQSAGQQTCRQQ